MAGIDARDADRRVLRPRGGSLQGPRGAAQGRRGGGRTGRGGGDGQAARAAALGRRARGQELGSSSTTQAARALIAQVGDRQQRLLRELEKLALEHGAGARTRRRGGRGSPRRARPSARRGRSRTPSWRATSGRRTRALLELRQQGERLPGLLYGMVRRLRDALAIAEALAAGQPPAQIKKGAADAVVRRRPADRRRVQARRRGVPARARADGRPRGREPRRRAAAACSARNTARAVARACSPVAALTLADRRCGARLRAADGRSRSPAAGRRARAARAFLRAPVLRCSAPRLTALSISCTSGGARRRPRRRRPPATAAWRRRK